MEAISFPFDQLNKLNLKRAKALGVGTIIDSTDYLTLLLKVIEDKSYSYSVSPELFEDSFFEGCFVCTGTKGDIDPRRLIVPELSLKFGALLLWSGSNCRPVSRIKELSKLIGIDYEKPFIKQDKRFIDILLFGYDKESISFVHKKKQYNDYYRGCVSALRTMCRSNTVSKGNIRAIKYFTGQIDCPICHGTKLNPETLIKTVQSKTILEILKMPINELQQFVKDLSVSLNEHQSKNLNELIDEINNRFNYFNKIGLRTLMPHLDKIP